MLRERSAIKFRRSERAVKFLPSISTNRKGRENFPFDDACSVRADRFNLDCRDEIQRVREARRVERRCELQLNSCRENGSEFYQTLTTTDSRISQIPNVSERLYDRRLETSCAANRAENTNEFSELN